MSNFTLYWAGTLFLSMATLTAQERVASLPGEDSTNATVTLLNVGQTPDATLSVSLEPGIFKAIAAPGGRLFFLSNSDNISYLTVTDASGGIVPGFAKMPVGPRARTMVMTSAGNKLLVLASTLYVFDVSGDRLAALGPVREGSQPIVAPLDVAVSHDGRRAFVVSTDRKLHAVNLDTHAVVGSIDLSPVPYGVTVGPNGLVYVGCYNALLEIEGGSEGGPMALRSIIALPYDTYSGRPVFTPSGRYIIVPNRTSNGPTVTAYDLTENTLKSLSISSGSGIGEISVASENVFYGIANGTLYKGDLTLATLAPARFTNDSALPRTMTSLAVSGEVPQARTMLVASESGDAWQVDVQSASVQKKISANPLLNNVSGARAGIPARVMAFNETQTVAPASRTLPLVVRAIGTDGHPVADVPVSWLAVGFDVFPMSKTNADGYAQAVLVAPATPWTYTATAKVGTLSQNFTVVVGSPGGNESPEGVHIIRGNGELITAFRLARPELEVEVRDADGKPVPDAEVLWEVSRSDGGADEGGSLRAASGDTHCTPAAGQPSARQLMCVTDENGRSIVEFSGGNSTSSPAAYTVTATSGEHSAAFFETVLPGGQATPSELALTVDRPKEEFTTITAPLGVPQTAAIQVSVYENSGGTVRPLPNVAVNIGTSFEPAYGPTATCAGGPVLTNGQGVAVCDLLGGGRLGSANLTVTIGGVASRGANVRINVVPGPATTIVIKGGDNQSGLPGQSLPIPLLAEMKDASGNLLQYADTTFEVVKGSATVADASKKSDYRGQASTFITLGSLPGDVEVLVKSGLAQATFKATVKGPAVSKATFLNGASFLPGIPLGGIVTVQAKGLLTGAPEIALGGCVTDADAAGKLPVRLANMEFLFGEQGVAAPMFSVCNIGENLGQVNLQVPWEVPAGAAKLKVRTGIGSETPFDVDVPGIEVLNAMPGVFTWLAENKTIAVANRMTDGAVITPSNPARPGETLRIFATGLGPVVPSAATNEYGAAGQKPEFTPVVILGGVGAGEVTSAYAEGMISVFSVDFKVPQTVPAGDLKLKLGVKTAPETVVYGPEVLLPVVH